MIEKKFACFSATLVIGAALIAFPAQARFGGFGGGGWHGGGGGWHGGFPGGGFRAGFVRGPAFVSHRAFVGRPFFVHRAFFPGRRFAFFPRRRFFGPFFGAGAIWATGYSSCWTWIPTAFGWQQIWVCGSPYGYF
jgi:hypothetical protein